MLNLNAAKEDVSKTFDVFPPKGVFEMREQRQEDLDVAGQQNLGVKHDLWRVSDVIAFLKKSQWVIKSSY